MNEDLDKYSGKTGTGGVGSRDVPLDPTLCPVEVVDSGRVTTWSQCSRKPKAGAVRPVRLRWTGDQSVEMLEVCGIHAAVHDRRVAKAEQSARDSDERKSEQIRVTALNIKGAGSEPNRRDFWKPSGRASLPIDVLEKMAEQLDASENPFWRGEL